MFFLSCTQVPGFVQDILYLTAVLNSCINPLIYGGYFYMERRNRERINAFRWGLVLLLKHQFQGKVTSKTTDLVILSNSKCVYT